jgi:glucose-6-phosphate 1-dehydrogenase
MNSNHAEGPTVPSPCVMVIFGATGDLTKRKLIPALLNLAKENVLSKQFAIIGVAGNDSTTESFRKALTSEIPQFAPDSIDLKMWDWLAERIYFVSGDFANPETYKKLQAQIDEVDKTHGCSGNKFYYMAVAPRFFATIAQQLGAAGMTKEENGKWSRVIVEKPFGHDLQSAVQLNIDLKKVLTEK